MNVSDDLKLEAYGITRSLVSKQMRAGKLPPLDIFGGDDLADAVGDVYAHVVLPSLDRFEPSKGSLLTFLYTRVMMRAPQYAWRLKKGGINTQDVLLFLEYPGDTDGDETAPWDREEREFSAELPTLTSVMTYPEPPEGYDVPGGDNYAAAQLAELRLTRLRRILSVLPRRQREQAEHRYLVDGNENPGNYPRYTDPGQLRRAAKRHPAGKKLVSFSGEDAI